MILTGVLFTNSTWYDAECSGGQSGQICASGGSITSTQSLINMFKAWGIDYNSLLSQSQSWGQSYSGSGTTSGWGEQIVVSATPIPDPDVCRQEKNSLISSIDPSQIVSRTLLIAEFHSTWDADDIARLMDSTGATEKRACVAIESPSRDVLDDHYKAIVDKIESKGMTVHYVDHQRLKYTWDENGYSDNDLNMLNIRDQDIRYRLSLISPQCSMTVGLFGAWHIFHDDDPENWYGRRRNLSDYYGSTAQVLDARTYSCNGDSGGNSSAGEVYIESGSGHSY